MSKGTRKSLLLRGLVVGVSGAGCVALTEFIVGRIPALNDSPAGRVVSRLALATGGALTADALGVPDDVAAGILGGAVLTSTLDVGVSLIGTRRVDPPPAGLPERQGDPWAPRPGYLP